MVFVKILQNPKEPKYSPETWLENIAFKDSFTFWDHRLDGEGMSGLHHTHGLVLGVVGHVGGAVEQLVNTCNKNKTRPAYYYKYQNMFTTVKKTGYSQFQKMQ